MTLTPAQYYPIDGSTIYMTGFAPAATVTAGSVDYTIIGDEDIMVTNQLSGTKATANVLSFTFNHLLTQLKFKVVAADNSFPSGVTVKQISVTNTQTSAALNLNDGTLDFSGGANDLTAFSDGNYAINMTGVTANELLMVEPGTAQILLDVVVDDNGTARTYTGVVVTLATVKGSSHLITLTFKTTAVTANATVAPWETGAGGDAEIN